MNKKNNSRRLFKILKEKVEKERKRTIFGSMSNTIKILGNIIDPIDEKWNSK